ncbi:MAG: GNAT family protein [Dehalococcoidia bacterium]|nr:GNAT family protein [Dehalococcoidia bacterium]
MLRPYRPGDLDDLLAYSTDERWQRFLPVPSPYTRADGERWIAESMAVDWHTSPRFAIEVEGRCSGGVDLRVDRAHAVAEIGYSLAPALWGRGLVVEAASAVITWAFEGLGMAKVRASADAENHQSRRVQEKLGMQREGYFRSERVADGERRDVTWYGLLREEWTPPATR